MAYRSGSLTQSECTGSDYFWLLSLLCKMSRSKMENRERRQNGRFTDEILPSETPLLLVLWLGALMSMLAHMGQTGVKGHLGPVCLFHHFIWLRLVCSISLNKKKEYYCLIKVASLLLLLFDSVFCHHWFLSLKWL